jgi:hypothetical protein
VKTKLCIESASSQGKRRLARWEYEPARVRSRASPGVVRHADHLPKFAKAIPEFEKKKLNATRRTRWLYGVQAADRNGMNSSRLPPDGNCP